MSKLERSKGKLIDCESHSYMYGRQYLSPDPVTLSLRGVLGNKEDTVGINFDDTGIRTASLLRLRES